MAKKSLHKFCGIILVGLLMPLIVPVSSLEFPAVHGAEPLVVPPSSSGSSAPPTSLGHGRGVRRVGAPTVASRHILVQLHPRTNEAQFLQNARAQGFRRLGRVYGSRWLTMSIPAGAVPRQAAVAARSLPGVLRATADPMVRINDQIPPRDPIYKDDDDPSTKPCDPLLDICDPWELVDQWGLFQVEAENGWVVNRGDPGVVIAILDSGMDLDHDDLWANIWTNPGEIPNNGIDDDGNGIVDDVHGADFAGDNPGGLSDDPTSQDGNPDISQGGTWVVDPTALPFGTRYNGDPAVGDAVDNDSDGFIDLGVFHGSFVAGNAGAITDNINPATLQFEGMAGGCWHCKLMPVRLINAEGWAFGSDAAAAIYYAADNGADVINISWGIDLTSAGPSEMAEIQIIEQAIDYAVFQGVIVVAAAGNIGTAGLHFPANIPNTIAVGSSNWLDQRSDFSSFAASGETLDVIAPGELIWSTAVLSAYDALLYDFLGLVGWEPGDDTYGSADGTSFSTPLVSGYVGLILSQNPGATLSEVRQVIRSNAVDILDPNGVGESLVGYDSYSGFGRLRMVVPTLTPEPNEIPVANAGADQMLPDKGKPGEVVTLDGSGSSDPDGTIVSYQWSEGGQQIATGETSTVSLPVGSHTITLRVTDDQLASSEDQVTIELTGKGGGGKESDGGGSSNPPTAMGVYSVDWSAKKNLDVTVKIRRDSNGLVGLDNGDEPVSKARVTLVLSYKYDSAGVFNCSLPNSCWTFQGRTDNSGNFRAKLLGAPAGIYQAEITALTHDIDFWEKTVDLENPETFTK